MHLVAAAVAAAELGANVGLEIAVAVVAEDPSGRKVASAAYVDFEWHAAAVVDAVEATAVGGGSSGSGVDCGTAVAEAIAVAAVAGIGALQVLDYHCGLGTVAFAAGIPGWRRMTSATFVKDAAVAAAVVAGYCRLSRSACPGASTSEASAAPDGVASGSRECYHRAFPVVDDHRASAADSVEFAELAAVHPCCSDDAQLPDGDEAFEAVAPAAGCVGDVCL